MNYKEYVEKLNSSPIFTTIAKNFNYKRIGLQITKNEEVLKEFTSYNKNGKIYEVKEGLFDPDFTAKVEEKVLKEIISKEKWISENPIEAAIKYANKVEIPFMVKLKLLRILSGF